MEIQRWIHKDHENVDFFGKHYTDRHWDFQWYVGENNIGISGQASTEGERFPTGILVAEDTLLITQNQSRPQIKRTEVSHGTIYGPHDNSITETNALIKLLMETETTHMYVTSRFPDKEARILAFSPYSPSKELYDKGKILPINVSNDRLLQEVLSGEVRRRMHARNQ